MKQNSIAKFKEIFKIKDKITHKKLLEIIDNLILLGDYNGVLAYYLEVEEDGVYIHHTFDYQEGDIDWGKYNNEDFCVNPYTQETWCIPLDRAVEYDNYQAHGKGKNAIESMIDLFLDIYCNSNNLKYDLIDSIEDILT